jgi:hypothetical protein
MLDLILTQEIGESSGMVESSAEPWQEVPSGASLIVWAPPRPDLEDTAATYLDTDRPIKVWQYVDHEIHEPADKTGAIQQYRDAMIYNPDARTWGYYEFGILSFSNRHDEAQVYLGVSCGPLCGEGLIYSLHRGDSGTWEIVQTDPRWIS